MKTFNLLVLLLLICSPFIVSSQITGYDLVIEENFEDNKYNWKSATKKEKFTIDAGRLVYENDASLDNYWGTCGINLPLESKDNYIIEISISNLEPCESKTVGGPTRIFQTIPKNLYCGFAWGNDKTNVAFAIGNLFAEKKYRKRFDRESYDMVDYTCLPAFYINNTAAGSSFALQDWTKNKNVIDGSNPNIIKIVKKAAIIEFYLNNQLVKSTQSFALGSNNKLIIFTEKKGKMVVNSIKVYKANEQYNELTTSSEAPKNKDVTKPIIVNGKFQNLEWSPVVLFEDQIFPSFIISTATTLVENQRDISSCLGISISSKYSNIPLKYEIECVEKKYFDKVSGQFTFEGNNSKPFYPNIPWDMTTLRNQVNSTPLKIYFRLYDQAGNKVEILKTVQIRSIFDCIYWYNDLDLRWMFAAYVNEENKQEIDKILKKGLDNKMVDSYFGYQGTVEDTRAQVAAIWRTLHEMGFKYSSVSSNAGDFGGVRSQYVRTFETAIKTKQANCIDGVVLFASILKSIEIDPIIIVLPGHAILGYYTDKSKNEIDYLETTLLSNTDFTSNAKSPAEKKRGFVQALNNARLSGKETFLNAKDKGEVYLIDITSYRSLVRPIGR